MAEERQREIGNNEEDGKVGGRGVASDESVSGTNAAKVKGKNFRYFKKMAVDNPMDSVNNSSQIGPASGNMNNGTSQIASASSDMIPLTNAAELLNRFPNPTPKKKKNKRRRGKGVQETDCMIIDERDLKNIKYAIVQNTSKLRPPRLATEVRQTETPATNPADSKVDMKLEIAGKPVIEGGTSLDNNTSPNPVKIKPNKNKRGPPMHRTVWEWLISPTKEQFFFANHWETKPLLISRDQPDYYQDLALSCTTVDEVLSKNTVLFGKHVDVTTYTNGVRETHNPEGRALPHIVWDFYKNGCSVRLLNPQAYISTIHHLNSELQSRLGFVGCNLYLTPAGSQGFAPHYDDIEAFVLQIEGTKEWKVYKPQLQCDKLPRYSSKNMKEEELGPPVIECTLKPGDMLYFPRGYIHQAKTSKEQHSLHITLSAYQQTTYIDLLDMCIPPALTKAAEKFMPYRFGLPLNMRRWCGLTKATRFQNESHQLEKRIKKLLHKFVDELNVDDAIDSFLARKLHDDLPPYLSLEEKSCTVHLNRTQIDPCGKIKQVVQLQLDSRIRLLGLHVCRLVREGDKFLLYYSVNNSLEYHEREREFLEVPIGSVTAVQVLYQTYPNYMQISHLPITGNEEKWSFANSLWEVGLIRTDKPLDKISVDDEDEDEDDDDDDDDDDDESEDDRKGEADFDSLADGINVVKPDVDGEVDGVINDVEEIPNKRRKCDSGTGFHQLD